MNTLARVPGVSELLERVALAYAELDPPSWPNPHPDGGQPARDEYSRVTDPRRYRIVELRAQVWTKVLIQLPTVTVEDIPARSQSQAEGFDLGVKLTCSTPGAAPMLFLHRNVVVSTQQPAVPVLRISVERPAMVVETWPDCGCDACDRGSNDLLDAIDTTVARVIGGAVVVLRHPRWYAQWSPDAGRSGGAGTGTDHARVMDLCRRLAEGQNVRLPTRTEAVVSHGWIT